MAKTNKTIPHVREISLAMQSTQQLICSRIGWTPEQYNEFQFETGFAFIEKIGSKLMIADVKQLKASRIFWGWWRNQWFSRDITAYDEILMTETSYREQNTNLLRNEQLQDSFWSRVSAMLADGKARLEKEAGNEV